MTAPLLAPDRRASVKERHRQAILDAAGALMQEHGGVHFTVDQLADRAALSRRTVFNHFASLDDIVTAVCSGVLSELVENLVAGATALDGPDGAATSMVDEVAHTLRVTDMVTPMSYLTRSLGYTVDESPWRTALILRSLDHLGGHFSAAMASRHPGVDTLRIDLLTSALMSGLSTLHRHWYDRTGAADDEHSRRVWAELVDQLLETLHAGYG
ncbi:TetR/AcrR family transcriptional regulator [Actinotalea sp. K2]|uniref:TetR family transcriptional regulator n=1 Tax=Actinotalea sp. K2 TaxID=2939438 RepID=UPI002017E3DB|nr:TetR/AcrR family transcriptional regulator [Actinotalea sp. K2]MCL3859767.1 TetR/AcrR family transcriptional regulator [Actinotalea sp. K2]